MQHHIRPTSLSGSSRRLHERSDEVARMECQGQRQRYNLRRHILEALDVDELYIIRNEASALLENILSRATRKEITDNKINNSGRVDSRGSAYPVKHL